MCELNIWNLISMCQIFIGFIVELFMNLLDLRKCEFYNLCHVELFYGFEDFEIGVVLMVNWARFDFQIFQGKYLVMLVISIFIKYAHGIL